MVGYCDYVMTEEREETRTRYSLTYCGILPPEPLAVINAKSKKMQKQRVY